MNDGLKYSVFGGFSLLEVLIVLFVISLTAAFIFPNISSQGSIKQDARLVASILRYVNDTTLATKEPCTLRANLKTKVLSYKCLAEQREYVLSSLRKIETVTMSVADNEEVSLLISPGQQDTLKIYLSEEHNNLWVQLNSLSGRVKIIEG